MPTLPSSSAREAREAVAVRLRELRLDAGLSGRELSTRCGWNPAKSSRIENAKTPPSDADIRAWCLACGAPDQAADLVAASRTADLVYVQWKRIHRTGLRRVHEATVPLYERTKFFRVYCSNVVPGLVQTAGYAEALLRMITEFQQTPDDVDEAVEARLRRSRVVREGDHRFALLVEESVLRHRLGDPSVMAAQLEALVDVMALPSVSLGVIPFTAARKMWPIETFMIFDDARVTVELLTAAVNVSAPGEVATYTKAFGELASMAVHGAAARALLTSAISSLR